MLNLFLVDMTTDRQCRASCSGDITAGAKPIPPPQTLSSLVAQTYWSRIQITDARRRWAAVKHGERRLKNTHTQEGYRKYMEGAIKSSSYIRLPLPPRPLSPLAGWNGVCLHSHFHTGWLWYKPQSHKHTHRDMQDQYFELTTLDIKHFYILRTHDWEQRPQYMERMQV